MDQRIDGFIWLDWIMDKIIVKHRVQPEEVEEAFFNRPYKVRSVEHGKNQFLGCSDAGRYLAVVFAWEGRQVKVITARDMTDKERRFFSRK